MPSPINPNVSLPPQSQGMRGQGEKGSLPDGAIDKGVRAEADSARISETAKSLNQVGDGNPSSLNGEQARQLATDIRAMFQASPSQALAAQANRSDLNAEQAQQMASDIGAMFQARPDQAMSAQAGNVSEQLQELLQQSA